MPESIVYNMDCLEYMRTIPDKFFELAVVDPPYGIGAAAGKTHSSHHSQKRYNKKNWDDFTPTQEYFTELFRISENQIICGGNHYTDKIRVSKGWIYWDKDNFSQFSDGELLWSSFDCGLRCVKTIWNGFRGKEVGGRFHPTQKPVALYKWLLQNYAKQGDKIFDSHMGSQSSRLAAYDMGFEYYGCELDKDYFEQGNKRFAEHIKQQSLFVPETQPIITQTKLL